MVLDSLAIIVPAVVVGSLATALMAFVLLRITDPEIRRTEGDAIGSSRQAADRHGPSRGTFRSALLTCGLVLATQGGELHAQSRDDLNALREESLRLVNEERAERDLEPLVLQRNANEAAAAHASDMLDRGFYDHVSPEGETVLDRYLAAGGTDSHLVLENLSRCVGCPTPADEGAVADMHAGWMDSPGHRDNILAEGISNYGFSIAENAEGTRFGVQVFSGAGVPLDLGQDEQPEPVSLQAQMELAASLINEERQNRELPSLAPDDILADTALQVAQEHEPGAERQIDLGAAMPSEADWRQIQLIVGSCTGCGSEPTDADIRYFVNQWLERQAYEEIMLDQQYSALGMAVHADGEGRKVAVALFGG